MEPDSNVHFQNLSNCMIDLDMFSRLPPNTWVHKDRTGHFGPSGGAWSGYPGVQTMTKKYKGLKPEKLAQDFQQYTENTCQAVSEIFKLGYQAIDLETKKRCFYELQKAQTHLKKAVEGPEAGGGMQGLLSTYPSKAICEQLKNSILAMQLTVNEAADISQVWYTEESSQSPYQSTNLGLPYCPEKHYSDEKWEEEIRASAKLRSESVDPLKYFLYSSTFSLNQVACTAGKLSKWNVFDEVIKFDNDAALVLGLLPSIIGAFGKEARNDLELIVGAGIAAILSVVEVFENHSEGYVASPVTPEQWREVGVKQLQLPTPDFGTIDLDLIERGVEFIHWNIMNGRSVYIHCKAGRGRSALIMMCYLIKYHGYSAQQAFDLIREKRVQAGFSNESEKWQTLVDYEKRCRAGGL